MAKGIKTRGPLFDGKAEQAIKDYTEDLEAELAQEGAELVIKHLSRFMKNPTGNYVSHIQPIRRGSAYEVTDGGVVYGPWLAGVSERNRSTRFKGYKHWRLAIQELEQQSGQTAQHLMPRLLRGIG